MNDAKQFDTDSDVVISRFRLSRSLSRQMVAYREVTGETMTGACLSVIRRGLRVPLELEALRLGAVLALGSLESGDLDGATKYLREIIDSGTISAVISNPRGVDEASNDSGGVA